MAADKKVLITCVPQTKTKNCLQSGQKKEGQREKEESMFVTLLIFHTLQIGVYYIWRGGGGYRMNGYKVVVGQCMVSAVVCVQWRSTAALCSSSVEGCPGGLKAVWKPGGGEWN